MPNTTLDWIAVAIAFVISVPLAFLIAAKEQAHDKNEADFQNDMWRRRS